MPLFNAIILVKYETGANMKRIIAILLLLALIAVALAACAAKSPERLSPGEVAKLHEQYPYADGAEEMITDVVETYLGKVSRNADMLDMLSLNWFSGVILQVEVIGELEEMQTAYTIIYHRLVRITDVIAANGNYDVNVEFNLGDEIYIGSAQTLVEQLPIGTRLITIGGTKAMRMILEKPRIRVGGQGMFIQTDDDYVLSMSPLEGYDKYSGMSADDLKALLAETADSWGWNDPEVYKTRTDILGVQLRTIEIENLDARLKKYEESLRVAIENNEQARILSLEEELETLRLSLEEKSDELRTDSDTVKVKLK
jgi:predicted small lipoprotein YifL